MTLVSGQDSDQVSSSLPSSPSTELARPYSTCLDTITSFFLKMGICSFPLTHSFSMEHTCQPAASGVGVLRRTVGRRREGAGNREEELNCVTGDRCWSSSSSISFTMHQATEAVCAVSQLVMSVTLPFFSFV